MESDFAPLWLEQAMELCERVLRKAAQRNPGNPALSKIVGEPDMFGAETSSADYQ
jgi:hypothetical protein